MTNVQHIIDRRGAQKLIRAIHHTNGTACTVQLFSRIKTCETDFIRCNDDYASTYNVALCTPLRRCTSGKHKLTSRI